MAQKSNKPSERACPSCGTKESKTPGGVARRAIEAAQSARQQAQDQQREVQLRRAMLQPPAPAMPQSQPMQRPAQPDPRASLLRAILAQRGGR